MKKFVVTILLICSFTFLFAFNSFAGDFWTLKGLYGTKKKLDTEIPKSMASYDDVREIALTILGNNRSEAIEIYDDGEYIGFVENP